MRSRAERRWVMVFALVVMLATLVPYMLGFAAQGESWRFTGFVLGVEDGNSYIAKMLSGASGAWLFRTPYTATPQKGMLAFLPYLLFGKLTAPPAQHEQLVVIYHLYRFVAGVLAILATYDFLALFIKQIWSRRLGVIVAVLGGGLGWLLVIAGQSHWLGSLPLEFYSPESFGFLGLFTLPHLALARALLLWGLVVYLRPPPSELFSIPLNRKTAPLAAGLVIGVLWWGLALAQPLTVVAGWFVLGLHLIVYSLHLGIRWARHSLAETSQWQRYLVTGVVAVVVSSPMVVYTFLAFQTDAYLSQWQQQNLILSPHPAHYLLAYGLLAPFAISGALSLLRSQPASAWLPAAWVIALPSLAYFPYPLQRRLPEGVWVALVALAMVGVTNLVAGSSKAYVRPSSFLRNRNLWKLTPLILLFPSTLFLYAGSLATAARLQEPAFQPAEKVAAFEHLAGVSEPGAVVLSSYQTGNALPAWSSDRVVAGHGPETADLAEVLPQIRSFFDLASTMPARRAVLDQYQVGYVFWGPDESSLGSWLPERASFLDEIFSTGQYTIFRVASNDKASSSAQQRASDNSAPPK